MIRILLADDQALIRSGIRSLLEAEDDIEVVAEASDGQQAVALAAEYRPDIALIDIQMPVVDGIEATRQIVADERLDSVRVVILTNFGLDEYIFRALRAGASGFLLKDTEPAELLQALRVVMRGDSLLSPAVTRRLIGEFVARPPDAVAISEAGLPCSGTHQGACGQPATVSSTKVAPPPAAALRWSQSHAPPISSPSQASASSRMRTACSVAAG